MKPWVRFRLYDCGEKLRRDDFEVSAWRPDVLLERVVVHSSHSVYAMQRLSDRCPHSLRKSFKGGNRRTWSCVSCAALYNTQQTAQLSLLSKAASKRRLWCVEWRHKASLHQKNATTLEFLAVYLVQPRTHPTDSLVTYQP